MSKLIHLIYSSAATVSFSDADLSALLAKSRENNQKLDISGMLLYADGSFFQILEGDPDNVDRLFQTISQDPRHASVTTIIREPIPKRAFSEWTMGYAAISSDEIDLITGKNDFFSDGNCFSQLTSGRAKKLLAAFKEGRWRSKLNGAVKTASMQAALQTSPEYTYAFQPIINAVDQTIFSYEAVIRGLKNEPAWEILTKISDEKKYQFDESSRAVAIALAAKLGIDCNLNLNFLPNCVEHSASAITSTLEAAERCQINPECIILEIDQDDKIEDHARFAKIIKEYRSTGIRVAIDNFGAGHAGLALLDQYQPEMIALNMNLLRDIESNGPRQAIFYGVSQTCDDLGIDIIAKGIETLDEYHWLLNEGIEIFQGFLFAKPEFEKLPSVTFPNATAS